MNSPDKVSEATPQGLVNNSLADPSLSQGDENEMSTLEMPVELGARMRVPEDIEKLFRNYHTLILQAAFRITGDRMEAEDVLQTLFLRLLNRHAPVDLKYSPGHYLRRAAVNLALDRLRRQKRQVPLEAVPDLAAGRSFDPGQAQLSSEVAGCLRSALARLKPTAAEIFVLRHFEGLSNSEIAKLLGTSWGTVAVTLHRAHRRLRKDLSSFAGGRS
jgi:RNA polymerase sigma-70 factor, ECF subfamily